MKRGNLAIRHYAATCTSNLTTHLLNVSWKQAVFSGRREGGRRSRQLIVVFPRRFYEFVRAHGLGSGGGGGGGERFWVLDSENASYVLNF